MVERVRVLRPSQTGGTGGRLGSPAEAEAGREEAGGAIWWTYQ